MSDITRLPIAARVLDPAAIENAAANADLAERARLAAERAAATAADDAAAEVSGAVSAARAAACAAEKAAQAAADEVAPIIGGAVAGALNAQAVATAAADAARSYQAAARTLASWEALAALTGAHAGEGAEVLDADAGTHADPVTGGTVPNGGRYSWSVAPAGWRRIGDTGISRKTDRVELADAVERRQALLRAEVSDRLAGHALVVFDKAGNALPLMLRDTDGAPDDWTTSVWLERMREMDEALPRSALFSGKGFAIRDRNGNLFPLVLRDTDGAPDDWTVDVWGQRLEERGYGRGDANPLIAPNMTLISGWGSSSMSYWSSNFRAMAEGFGAAYIDGGKGGEVSGNHGFRQGALPAYATFPDNTIPESGSVVITTTGLSLNINFKPSLVIVAGVEGILTTTASQATFTRSFSGPAVGVEPGTPIISYDGLRARNGVQLFNVGKNNITNITTVRSHLKAMYEHISSTPRRAIIIGHFVNRDTDDVSASRTNIYTLNAEWAAEYGGCYFDQQDYLMSEQVWADTGITPTAQDVEHQSRGNLAPSLSDAAGIHMIASVREAVAARLTAHISALGWFN